MENIAEDNKQQELLEKIANQRKFLQKTPQIPLKTRKEVLKKLYQNIKSMMPDICDALQKDLNKSPTESYMTEIGLVLEEISYMLRHLRSLMRKKHVYTPISNFPAKSFHVPCAYGVVLIISPWNYPFLLAVQPLVDAIAAGNTVILKPSSNSANTSAVLESLLASTFDEAHATTILWNSKQDGDALLEQEYDFVFYTGSTNVGQKVLQSAAKHFTPAVLEMGGKSPCIVDESANIKLAAKRIVFGKFLNAGQTCVAPDFVFCHENVKDALVREIEKQIVLQYSIDPILNKSYPKMINEKQFNSVLGLIDAKNLIFGGKFDENVQKIEPTLVCATFEDEVMQREIFGPVLPIVTFKNLDEVVEKVGTLPKPLAFYVFTKNRKNAEFLMSSCQFGGGCVNDTIMHIANNHLGFGGIKQSGMGAYHGKVGFQTFSHFKNVVKKANWLDLPMRYQPFNKFKDWLIKMFLK